MEINKKGLLSLFGMICGCIVVYWLLHETERVRGFLSLIARLFSPFVVGATLAFILNVPMRGIERLLGKVKRLKHRRGVAVLLTILAILLVLTAVFCILIPQISATVRSVVAELPGFFGRIEKSVTGFLAEHPEILQWLVDNTSFENFDWTTIVQKAATIAGNSVTTIANSAFAAVGSIASAVVNAVVSLVFALYCLSRKEILARQGRRLLYSFLPEHICDKIVRILRLTNSTFSNFISGQCLEACILGGMFAVTMSLFRMPYVPLVSVLVAVTALIPLVGAFVGCILGALFILVDSPLQALWFVILFLVLQQIENNVIYPRVVGTSIGLPGMWVLLAVTIGGDLMGVGGMLLMIPLASVCYVLLRELTDYLLSVRKISPDKLQDHPPELRSKFKEKRERVKQKRDMQAKTKKEKE